MLSTPGEERDSFALPGRAILPSSARKKRANSVPVRRRQGWTALEKDCTAFQKRNLACTRSSNDISSFVCLKQNRPINQEVRRTRVLTTRVRASRGIHRTRVSSNIRQIESLPAEPCESRRSGDHARCRSCHVEHYGDSGWSSFLDEPMIEGRGG